MGKNRQKKKTESTSEKWNKGLDIANTTAKIGIDLLKLWLDHKTKKDNSNNKSQ